ncbi:hypothetical protein [Streptomyces candidus]|uniref:Uncharacterized protein n=1 Tax=Streptomyces candidus TaxID=67283 RepID=A0A7X0LNK1_9ACTN|nr:hypothetical protein [Streptomyces candidus]MBB6434952.1 hypothetical protein [Streptomyces candidus]GHH41260.1 hypothetical protein GCM10018773_24180 [Streptomyces candidus]
MSAPEREVEKPMTPAAAPGTGAPVTMRALLASCAAATAVSTPPREAAERAADSEEGAAGRREAA